MNDTPGGLPGDSTMIAEANKTFLPQLLWTTRRRRPQGVAATMWKQSSCETINSEHPDQFRAKCGVFRAISHHEFIGPCRDSAGRGEERGTSLPEEGRTAWSDPPAPPAQGSLQLNSGSTAPIPILGQDLPNLCPHCSRVPGSHSDFCSHVAEAAKT